jgi:hypothetical protein
MDVHRLRGFISQKITFLTTAVRTLNPTYYTPISYSSFSHYIFTIIQSHVMIDFHKALVFSVKEVDNSMNFAGDRIVCHRTDYTLLYRDKNKQ